MKTSNEPYKIKEAEGVEEDEADDLQEDVQAHECTPGDGDSLELGDGLLIVRQPKKSDADIVTAEVSTSGSSDIGRVILPLIIAAALSLGGFLLQRHWSKKKKPSGSAKPQRVPNYSKLVERISLMPEEASSSLLSGKTVIASNLLFKGDSRDSAAAEGSPQLLNALLENGAEISGRTRTEERYLGLLERESAATNPALPESIASGTGSGVAMAAAAGLADVGIGMDHLIGPRVHAACTGVWGFRASSGVGQTDGQAAVAGSLDSVGWACQNPRDLQLIGDALKLPGTVSKGNLLQVLVAEDLYDRLGESADILKRATYKAAKRWAGQEEVCRMRAMSFLYDACPSARFFMQDPDDDKAIMEGLREAAVAVQSSEFARVHERVLDQPGNTPVEVLKQLKQAAKVVPEAVEHGRKVMIEASTQLREILVAGNLLILPNLPSPPPSGEAPQEELEAWERGTLELSCLAPLAGLPQVSVPVVLPDRAPMSVAIVALQRSDKRLLAAAMQLGPYIQEAAAQLAAKKDAPDASADSSSASSSPAKPLANGNAARKQSPGKGAAAAAQKGDAQVQAETHKTAGNEAFKAGAYEEAVRAYSQAIESNPACAVYWSNRAQAYLKLMLFDSAEADCDKALKLELSVKTLLRRGTARRGKQDIEGARRDYKHALGMEPNNRQARQDLQKLKEEEETLRQFSEGPPSAVPDTETNGLSAAAKEPVFL